MRTLICGDPHIQHQKIDDAKTFLNRLTEIGKHHDQVILLGDLFHTFAVIRSEVLELWHNFFSNTQNLFRIIALVGNHDYCSQSGGTHALEVFKRTHDPDWNSIVVDRLYCIDGVYFLPFVRDNNEFATLCRDIPAGSILVCHQSFTGAEFETGFKDPHGVDLDCVAHLKAVISGHIHKYQILNNVWYPGTPFQHSFGEAGQEKRIYSIDLQNTGYTILKAHDLEMPSFEIIEQPTLDMISLPAAKPNTSYKIVARGTPQEIKEFWERDQTKQFKAQAKRLIDGIVPERGQINIAGINGKTQSEKLEQFIQSKKWRTDASQLLATAGLFLSEGTSLR